MTFLPIVARELRVASRRRLTYWLRLAAAFAILLVGAWALMVMHNRPPREVAPFLFYIVTGGAVVYAWVAGVNATFDCVSREKREGTLGLLFLTDLKGYDIILGKLAATSLGAVYSLLAIVPLMAIPILMGGIAPGEFWRMSLVALNTLFFSLTLGLAVSVASRSGTKALLSAGLILVVVNGLLPLIGLLIALNGSRRIHPVFLVLSSGFGYGRAFDQLYIPQPGAFWLSLGLNHVLSWLLLGFACLRVPHCWQDRPMGKRVAGRSPDAQPQMPGDNVGRREFRRQALDQNPFYWLAVRSRFKPLYVWLALGAIGCWWLWGIGKYGTDWFNEFMYVVTAFMTSLLLRCWFAWEASRTLAEQRRAGSLELLLSTPLTVAEILRGQWLALKRQFLFPLLLLLGVEFLFMLGCASNVLNLEDRVFWIWFWPCAMVSQALDFWALYWVGMWRGLTNRSSHVAAVNTMTEVLTTPWLIIAVAVFLAAMQSIFFRHEPNLGSGGFLALWFFAGLAVDLGFGLHARKRLLNSFRSAAERAYAPRSPAGRKRSASAGQPGPVAPGASGNP